MRSRLTNLVSLSIAPVYCNRLLMNSIEHCFADSGLSHSWMPGDMRSQGRSR